MSTNPATLPAVSVLRSAICLTCRTVLCEGEACDLGCDGGILSLDNPHQRAILVRSAWDENQVRFSAKSNKADYKPLRLPALVSGTGAVLMGAGVVGSSLGVLVLTGPWMLLPFLSGRSTRKLFSAVRPGRHVKDSIHQGHVLQSDTSPAPGSHRPCVGFSIRLHHKRTESDTLVDSFSFGFKVQLQDGRIAWIPKGRIRLVGTQTQLCLVGATEMLEWWAEIDPGHRPDDQKPPYPFSHINETVICEGQQVLLLNQLVPSTDAARHQPMMSYRDNTSLLEPLGVPRIKLL